MLPEVTDLQNEAVSKMVSLIPQKDEITFKAPTGSGKTYMMADFMERVLTEDDNVIFIVSSLSKGRLAKQNYEKFDSYRDFSHIKPYLINSETSGENSLFIPTDYNVYVLPRDLYKDKSKLKQGALHQFLYTITTEKPMGLEKKIYVIKDECHIATSNLDSLREDFFSKVFNFSATPKLRRGQLPDVEITEIDAVSASLIKRVSYQPPSDSLDDALMRFLEIKRKYQELLGINPCMIIQISNKDKADEELKSIFSTLHKTKYQDLKWMLIVDKDSECDTNDVFRAKKLPVAKWTDYAKSDTAAIDLIIFKMVITEGWDIPRACMLYQIRDTSSTQLDEQVIGRVRRNPRLLSFETLSAEAQSLATTAYVWGMEPESGKVIRQVSLYGAEEINEVQNEIKLKTTIIKPIFQGMSFDVDDYLRKKKGPIVPSSIFALYATYRKTTPEVKCLCDSYSDTYCKWLSFMEYESEIRKESTKQICNYDVSMAIRTDEFGRETESSFPLISYYAENGNFKNISNWIWKRTDGSEKFSFDSEAEKQFAEILLELVAEDAPTGKERERVIKKIPISNLVDGEMTKYAIGKNFLPNSEIRYEYYMDGIRSSYPDFIMKDWKDRIHIIETKSVNKSATLNVNEEDYKDKVRELRKCYKKASELTNYYFYIPIMKDDDFTIYAFFEGNERIITAKQFTDFVKGKIEL